MRSCWFVLIVLCALTVPVLAAEETPARGTLDLEGSSASAGERYLEPLAIGLARALGSDGFRQSLYENLQASRYVEGRVPLKRLLAQEPGLRQELLWHADLGVGWERIAEALPELELYFPSREHRAAWSGDLDVRVAVATDREGVYRSYAPDGPQTTFAATEPPEVPTLLLGPSEIDYDDLESALEGGKRTGSYLRRLARGAAEDGSEPVAGLLGKNQIATKASGVDSSRHTYLTAFEILQDYDFWGSMEIEIFGSIDGSYSRCQRFTGIDQQVTYYLPAPGSSGAKKIAYAVPTGTNTVDLDVYEDDDTGCVIKGGDDYVGYSNITFNLFGFFTSDYGWQLTRVETMSTTCGDSVCEGDESRTNCCGDCASCGDGVCSSCESGSSCSADCYVCGNGICERTKGENEYNCSADCDSCGNGFCEPGEDYLSCPFDCCDPEGPLICPE